MEELKNQVEKLVEKEIVDSNKKFCSIFHSTHEGYAIIKEEVEEAEEELENVQNYINSMWRNIKMNDTEYSLRYSNHLKKYAINLAAESIQVAAMAQKFIDSFKNEGGIINE